MFRTKVVQKIKTHILCSVTFIRKPFFLSDNVEKYFRAAFRPQMTIWSMRIVWWIPKATNTHSENATCNDFPLQQQLHEGTSLLCLVLFMAQHPLLGHGFLIIEALKSLYVIHLRCVQCVQISSKVSQVKTQLVLWIFTLFMVTRWQHVSAYITRPSSGHK
jgi:hypothetical protein